MYRLIAPIIVILFAMVNVGMFSTKENFQQIKIKSQNSEHKINVELAITKDEQALGLMHISDLPEGRGMLFVYDTPGIPYFWMKNMLISLDMIFISENNEILHIVHNAPPCKKNEKCLTYSHNEPIKYVLEVPAGYAQKNSIKNGDKLILN